jgi:hypothetical protein
MDGFAGTLTHFAQGKIGTLRLPSGFFRKFPNRGAQVIFSSFDFSARDGPGAIVFSAPIRTTGVNKQHFQTAVVITIHH